MIKADSSLPSSDADLVVPAPFLKWAGGKSQMLPHLAPYFPRAIKRYFEPFLGGGAVFFYLRGQGQLVGEVILADLNLELINAYRVVQASPTDLMAQLDLHQTKHCKDHYYEVRSKRFTEDVEGAARTVYLNKTCFNGLYRVNSSGDFNVPMGDYKNPRLYDAAAMLRAAQALQGVTLLTRPYEETLALCLADDFIYLDPPYLPLSPTSSFTAYTPHGFNLKDHERLAKRVLDCHEKGAAFVLSNSCQGSLLPLYPDFQTRIVPSRRHINCVGTRRACVQEVIITNRGV